MGYTKDISTWDHFGQRMYSENQRPMPNHDLIKLAKKKREPARNDKELSKHSRIKCEW